MPDYEARITMLTEENDILREENAILKKEIGIAQEIPVLFHALTPAESTILSVLLANKLPKKSTFMLALYGNKHEDDQAQEKIVDVFVCKLRKKISDYGIEIGTTWGRGYFMSDEHKTILRQLIEAA